MFDLFREISQTLRNNRLRTFLTGIAVAWGIFMLIVLLGMARGVLNSFESMSWSQTSNRITVYPGNTSMEYKGYREGRPLSPEMSDVDLLSEKNPDNVGDVMPSASLSSTVFSTAKDYLTAGPSGVYPKARTINDVDMKYGRFINDADILDKRKSIVLEEKDAALLFGDASTAVGQRLDGLGLSWLVVGVYASDWRNDVYIPFTTAKMLSGNDSKVNNLQVEIKNVQTIGDGEKVEEALRGTLAKAHDYDPQDKSALYMFNRFTNYLQSLTAFNILNVSVWVIGIFTLLSGIIGVSNIMFVSVRERTHEIGIRRAIGAKPRAILTQIILESVSITFLFGYIGVFFGMCVTQLIAHFTAQTEFLKNPTVSLQIALEVTIVLIVAGALAGLFPALKATKVKPVEALRDE